MHSVKGTCNLYEVRGQLVVHMYDVHYRDFDLFFTSSISTSSVDRGGHRGRSGLSSGLCYSIQVGMYTDTLSLS